MAMPQRTMSKCDAGSRSVAALLAACTTSSGWRRLQLPRERGEALELRREVVVAGLVGGREVGHQAGQLERGRRRRPPRPPRAPRRGRRCRAGPSRCRASRARAAAPLPARRARRSRPTKPSRQATTSASAASASAQRPRGVSAPITRIRASIPWRRRSPASRRGRHRQPGRAALQRGLAPTTRAVAVAVRLHDRAQLGAGAQQRRAGARSCARPRPGRRARAARSGALTSARQARRERVDHVARDHVVGAAPAPPRRWPARACASTPSAAASNGPSPFASSAPIRPESTSPVPAVASAGRAARADRDRPAGRGDDRVVALQQHDAPLRSAASRAGRSRWRPTSSESVPSRRPSSPACGVSTVGAARPAQRLEPLGVRVQAVRVDQQRRLDARGPPRARTPARRPSGRARGRARPRPRARPSPPRLARPPACARRRSSGSPRLISSSSRRSIAGCAGAGHRDLHVAGAGPRGGERGHRGRAGQPPRRRPRPPPRRT